MTFFQIQTDSRDFHPHPYSKQNCCDHISSVWLLTLKSQQFTSLISHLLLYNSYQMNNIVIQFYHDIFLLHLVPK